MALVLCAASFALGRQLMPRIHGRPALSPGAWFAFGASLVSVVSVLASAVLNHWSMWKTGVGFGIWNSPHDMGVARLRALLITATALGLAFGISLYLTKRPDRRPSFNSVGHRRAALILGTLVILGGAAHLAWAFITPLNYDVLSYHLPLACRFEEFFAGSTSVVPYSWAPFAPSAFERFASWPESTGAGLGFCRAVAVIAGASSCASVAARLGARTVGRLGAACLYTWHPMVVSASQQHLSDVWLGLLGAAAAEALLSGTGLKFRHPMLLLGVWLTAFAVTTKLNALGIAAIPLAVVVAMRVSSFVRSSFARGTANQTRFAWRLASLVALGSVPFLPWCWRFWWSRLDAPFYWMDRPALRDFIVGAHHPLSPLESGYWGALLSKVSLFGYSLADVFGVLPALGVPLGSGSGLFSFVLVACLGVLIEPRFRSARHLLLGAMLAYAALALVRDQPTRFYLGAMPWVCAIGARYALAGSPIGVLRTFLRAVLASGLGGLLLAQLVLAPSQPFSLSRSMYRENLAILGSGYFEVIEVARGRWGERALCIQLFDGRNHLFRGGFWSGVTAWVGLGGSMWQPESLEGEYAFDRRRIREDLSKRDVFVNEFELGRILDFYARDKFKSSRMGNAGTQSPEFVEELLAWPGSQIEGMTRKEAEDMAWMLRKLRKHAIIAVPAGPKSEIWLAPMEALLEEDDDATTQTAH